MTRGLSLITFATLLFGGAQSLQAQDEHAPKDRVVVLHAEGTGTAGASADAFEDYLADAVKQSNKVAVYEQVPLEQAAPPHPQSEAEARTIAEIHGSQFLIAGRLKPGAEERVAVEIHIGSVEHERYDTARFEVFTNRLRDAVLAVVPLALRDEGLGPDGLELTRAIEKGEGAWSKDGKGVPEAKEEPEPPKDPAPEVPAPEPVLQSSLSQTGPLSLGAGLALRPLLSSAGEGGVLVGPAAQGRYRLAEGLSVHANLGLIWGAASALELSVGAAFLPLRLDDVNLLMGASAEVGAYFSFSGSRDPALLVRVSPTLFFALSSNLGLDIGVLEFGWISGADALTLGGHVRLRYSF